MEDNTSYPLDLYEDEREELGRLLRDKIRNALDARREVVDNILRGRDQYDAASKPKSFPWPNSANLNVPITRSILDSIHARCLRVMTGVAPFFRVTPFSGSDVTCAKRIEEHLEWQMNTEVDMAAKLDQIVHVALRDGNVIGYAPWKKEIRVTRDRVPLDDDLRGQLGTDAKHVRDKPDGTHVHVEREEIVKDGPDLEPITVPNWVMYPHNAKSIEKAIFCGHRIWNNDDDLHRNVKDGVYDETYVGKLLSGGGGERPDPRGEQYGGDPDRASDIGIDTWTDMDPEEQPFECFQIVGKYDADKDGIAEDCLFVVEMSTAILLRAECYPYWHGRRCYINYCPYPRPEEFYGYSVPGILEHLAAEVNAIRNQRVDAGTLTLSPMLVGRRGARYDPNKNRWRPGGILWLDNTDDVKPLIVGTNTQSAFAEEAAGREMAERVSGVSDYAQGQSPSRSRTLGEVQAVLQEGNLKFDVVIQRLQRANNEFGMQVLGLNRQFLTDKTEFLIDRGEGQDPLFRTITKEDIVRRVGLRAHGNTVNSNKELTLQTAEKLYMMSERCVLMQKPSRLYAIVSYYLGAMEIKNIEPFIGTMEEAEQMEKAQMSAPAPGPEPSISGKMDEISTLAMLLKSGDLTPDDIGKALQVLGQVQQATAAPAENNFATASSAPAQNGAGGQPPDQAGPGAGSGSSQLDQLLAQVGG